MDLIGRCVGYVMVYHLLFLVIFFCGLYIQCNPQFIGLVPFQRVACSNVCCFKEWIEFSGPKMLLNVKNDNFSFVGFENIILMFIKK